MAGQVIGKVLGIAVRSYPKGPMREIHTATVQEGRGIEGDLPSSPNRAITLLAAGQWRQVSQELGTTLPWYARRANVLIDCEGLGHVLGKTVKIGPIRMLVLKETKPCELMDEQHVGLRRALEPDCRGGVNGRVLQGGSFNIGDLVIVETKGDPAS